MKKFFILYAFCMLSIFTLAQEIILIPQGKDQLFPDIKLVNKVLFQEVPFMDCFQYEYTPLMIAISKEDLEAISKLISEGANVNEWITNESPACPTSDPLLVGVFTGNKKIVSYLLEKGAVAKNNNQLWRLVVAKDLMEIADILIRHGIHPGTDALRRTVILNKPKFLKLILEKDKTISEKQKNEILGMLRKWTQDGFDEIIYLLDPNYKNLQRALKEKDLKTIKEIKTSAGMESIKYIFIRASETGNLPFIQTLFAANIGLQTEYKDCMGNTPLMLAVMNGYTDIVKFLLEKGANADIIVSFADLTSAVGNYELGPEYEYLGEIRTTAYTPLMKALEREDKTMVDLLLKYGAKDHLLVLFSTTMEGPTMYTTSAHINEKCSRHRHAYFVLYGGSRYPESDIEQPWEKECDFPTEYEVYRYFMDNFKP